LHQPVTRQIRGAVMAVALGATLLSAYAIPRAQQAPAAAGKKVLTVEDYTKWRTITSQAISGDGNWAAYVLSLTNVVQADAKPVLHLVRLESTQQTEIANATSPVFSADSKWIAYQVDPTGGRGGRGRRGGGPGGATPPAPGDTAVPPGSPAAVPPANPAQTTTPPGQNPPTAPGQPPTTPAQPEAVPPTQPSTPPPAPQAPAPAETPGERGRGATPPEQPTRVELRNLATGTVKSWQDMQGFVFSPTSNLLALKQIGRAHV